MAIGAPLRATATPLNALHALLTLLSLTVAFGTFDGTLFGWHPWAMSLGYLFFMAEGLVMAWAVRPTLGGDRVRGLVEHATMQVRALLFIAIGAVAIMYNKHRNGKPHFRTLHGKVGLATLALSVASPLLGAATFRKLGLIQRFPEAWHQPMKRAHRALGAVTWALALVATELALPHPAVRRPLATPLWRVGVAAAGGSVALLLYARRRGGSGSVLKGG